MTVRDFIFQVAVYVYVQCRPLFSSTLQVWTYYWRAAVELTSTKGFEQFANVVRLVDSLGQIFGIW